MNSGGSAPPAMGREWPARFQASNSRLTALTASTALGRLSEPHCGSGGGILATLEVGLPLLGTSPCFPPHPPS